MTDHSTGLSEGTSIAEDGLTFSDEMHVRQSIQQGPASALFRQMGVQDVACDAAKDADQVAEDKSGDRELIPQKDQASVKMSREERVTRSESTVIRSVVHTIDDIEEHQRRKGFREAKFTIGLVNSLLISYSFGSFPQHFWIVYLLESLYFIPAKFVNMVRARPLCEAFYYFDFCWMMNFLGLISVFILILESRDVGELFVYPDLRKNLYMATFGIACGPLTGATAILPFVAFLFHDLNTMTNLVIHMMPPMLLYTIRWHADEVREAYGSTFDLSYLKDVNFFPTGEDASWWWFLYPPLGKGSIAGNAVIIYMGWFISYVSWMLLIGLEMPVKREGKTPRFDTVFHSLWRGGPCEICGTLLWKRNRELSRQQMQNDDYELRDFAVYMSIHAFLAILSIPVLAQLSNYSPQSHSLLLLGLLIICAHRGGIRYTYYVTEMYGDRVRKKFLLDSKQKRQKQS